jgi:hypothetical protein
MAGSRANLPAENGQSFLSGRFVYGGPKPVILMSDEDLCLCVALGAGNCRDLFVKLRPLGKEGPVGAVLRSDSGCNEPSFSPGSKLNFPVCGVV